MTVVSEAPLAQDMLEQSDSYILGNKSARPNKLILINLSSVALFSLNK